MAVFKRKWLTRKGEPREAWYIKFTYRHPDGNVTRVAKHAEHDTKERANDEERDLYTAIKAGTYKRHAGLTFDDAATRFLTAFAPPAVPGTFGFYEDQIDRVLRPLYKRKQLTEISQRVGREIPETLRGTEPRDHQRVDPSPPVRAAGVTTRACCELGN